MKDNPCHHMANISEVCEYKTDGCNGGTNTTLAVTEVASGQFQAYKMVLVVRNDLKMGKGKIAAQCCHAALSAYRRALIKKPHILQLWQVLGEPKIVLKADSEDCMMCLVPKAKEIGILTSVITDAGHTQVAPGSKTVLALGPGSATLRLFGCEAACSTRIDSHIIWADQGRVVTSDGLFREGGHVRWADQGRVVTSDGLIGEGGHIRWVDQGGVVTSDGLFREGGHIRWADQGRKLRFGAKMTSFHAWRAALRRLPDAVLAAFFSTRGGPIWKAFGSFRGCLNVGKQHLDTPEAVSRVFLHLGTVLIQQSLQFSFLKLLGRFSTWFIIKFKIATLEFFKPPVILRFSHSVVAVNFLEHSIPTLLVYTTPPLPVPSPEEKGGGGAVTSSLKNLGSAGPADSTLGLKGTHRSINIGWGLIIGVCQHGDDRDEDGLHRMDGQPALRGLLIAKFVIPRLMEDGDAHVDMEEATFAQEMKRHAVIVSLAAGHNDSEIAAFLKATQSFSKVRRKLGVAKELKKNPVEGFSAGLIDDDDIYKWEVLIIGPPETLYEGGFFKAHLYFPKEYPLCPPKMKFITEIWHPNIDKTGDVCISILHEPGDDKFGYEKASERWLPVHTVETILISVISMLADPNDESPANVDAATHNENKWYRKIEERSAMSWLRRSQENYRQRNYLTAHIDESSDLTLSNGGARINIILQDGTHIKVKEEAGKISSNFTCALTAIWKALDVCLNQPSLHQAEGIIIYNDSRSTLEAIQKGNSKITQKIHLLLNQLEPLEKNCILQWIPAHVGIWGNEMAEELANEARKLSQRKEQVSVFDAVALAKYKIIQQKKRKGQICEINSREKIYKNNNKTRMKHYKGMTIHPDGTRTYRTCNKCPDVELTPTHILSCPEMTAALQKIDMNPEQQLYTPKIENIATAVIEMWYQHACSFRKIQIVENFWSPWKMAISKPKSAHLREILLFAFNWKKSATEAHRMLEEVYCDHALSKSQCYRWFKKFQSGDFELDNEPRGKPPQKFEDAELQALLDEDSTQMQEKLAKQLQVSQVPHELSKRQQERRLVTCEGLLARHEKKSFLHQIITSDEKWIHFSNPMRQKSWGLPGQFPKQTPRPNRFGKKAMLCVWWDQTGVVYFELLKPGEMHNKLILQHDNAPAHNATVVKNTIKDLGWDLLPHPPYSPDLAPSDYHLFTSLGHALKNQEFLNSDILRKWLVDWFDSKGIEFFRQGIRKLLERVKLSRDPAHSNNKQRHQLVYVEAEVVIKRPSTFKQTNKDISWYVEGEAVTKRPSTFKQTNKDISWNVETEAVIKRPSTFKQQANKDISWYVEETEVVIKRPNTFKQTNKDISWYVEGEAVTKRPNTFKQQTKTSAEVEATWAKSQNSLAPRSHLGVACICDDTGQDANLLGLGHQTHPGHQNCSEGANSHAVLRVSLQDNLGLSQDLPELQDVGLLNEGSAVG
ncbi:UBE2G1 [Cordylochernes scorpioides]|uniref:peptidyl-tRNA hydrolase n=1 Tax=Cordylochernes scorpioides TaxID=51811 RepID=A0ABY6KNG9_9ARAC|nr:UBE2G1 [Cordylochernes scorpioides]